MQIILSIHHKASSHSTNSYPQHLIPSFIIFYYEQYPSYILKELKSNFNSN